MVQHISPLFRFAFNEPRSDVSDCVFGLLFLWYNYHTIMADIEEMCKKILSMKGVLGFIILNTDGCSIKTSFDAATTTSYVTKIHQLVSAVRNSLHELDATNDLSFLRIRSKKHELLIAPDKEYMLIVIQQPSASK